MTVVTRRFGQDRTNQTQAKADNGNGLGKKRQTSTSSNSYSQPSQHHRSTASVQTRSSRLLSAQMCANEHDEVDLANVNDAQYVTEYIHDINRYYRDIEARLAVSATYMTKQTDVNEKMRAILVDWLIEVHHRFKLMPETLYLSVQLLDRFLADTVVARTKLQLVGVAAMFIASKFEEIYAPEVRDFVYISDNMFTQDEILKMEAMILNTLQFQLSTPTVYVYLKRFSKVAGIDVESQSKIQNVVNMLVELAQQEYALLNYLPSNIAASAIFLALKMNDLPWTELLVRHTKYSEGDLQPCAKALAGCLNAMLNQSSKLEAVKKKYSGEKYEMVAKMVSPINL